MVQTQTASRKQRIERAIAHALDRRWDQAAEANRALLGDYPDDVESANRLGKALTELDDFAGAAEAYERALTIDSTNAIARKNLARLRELTPPAAQGKAKKAGKAGAGEKARAQRPATGQPVPPIRVHSLIEESGRSAEFALLKPDAEALKDVTAGDTATLDPTANGVVVQSDEGVALGTIEPRAALRLKRMMEGGNRYAVVVRRVADGEATVYIREVYTQPSLVGQPSFVPSGAGVRRRRAPRAYTKPSVVHHDREVETDDFDEDREEGWSPRRGASLREDEDDAMERRGFSATTDEPEEEEEDEVEFDDEIDVGGDYEDEEED